MKSFSRNEFWKNIVRMIFAHIFGVRDARLPYKEEKTKITERKMKNSNLRRNVYLYDICDYYVLFPPLFILL